MIYQSLYIRMGILNFITSHYLMNGGIIFYNQAAKQKQNSMNKTTCSMYIQYNNKQQNVTLSKN